MSTGWRVASGLVALLFAYAAVVQYNDPDPIRWTLLYAVAAVAVGVSITMHLPPSLPLALAALSFGWAALIVPGVVRVAELTGSEEEREIAGLLLVGAVSVGLFLCHRRPRKAPTDSAESPSEP